MSKVRALPGYVVVVMLVLVMGAVAVPGARANGDGVEELIGGFESGDEGWTLGLGPEFPGAQGEFVRDDSDAHAGTHSGLLTGDFSQGGNYVQISRAVDLDVQALRMWVRSADVSGFRLRMVDSTGQTHQQRIALSSGGSWQEISVDRFNGGDGYLRWGGANDGAWHGPAQRVTLLVDKADLATGASSGQIRFDEITAMIPTPDLVLEQTRPGNVFVEGEPVEFSVVTAGDAVSWAAVNHRGEQVAAGQEPADGTVRLRVPVDQRGHFRLRIAAERDGEVIDQAETTFALLEPFDLGAVEESPFGMATHFGQTWSTDLIPLLARAGVKNIRDEMYWAAVERVKGQYDFSGKHDAYMGILEDNDVDPFILFSYTNPHYDGGATPYTDEGRQGFADYGAAILDHYGDQIPWVEVYNEFNIHFGDRGDGPADSRPDYYYWLLETTYDEVKSRHPDVTVVGASTAGVPLDWLEEVFALGGLDKMDAVSVHPYVYPGAPERAAASLDALDSLIKQYNDGESKPVWISEQGWPTHVGVSGVSEATQAAYLVRSHVVAFSKGVEKYFWYDFMNDGLDPTYNEHNFGIVRHTNDPAGRWVPKPAYVSYAVMARQLTGAGYTGPEPVADGVHSHVFTSGAAETRVIWADEPRTVAVKTTQPVTVIDLMGAAETYQPQDGVVHLSVAQDPVYLTGSGVSLAETGRLSLTADDGGTAVVGDAIGLTLTVDNTGETRPLRGRFEVAGESVQVAVPPRKRAEIPVNVAASDDVGDLELVGRLIVGERKVARLATSVNVKHPLAVSAKHVIRGDAEVLEATVRSEAKRELAVGDLEWTLGERSGTAEVPSPLPAGEQVSVAIELAGVAAGRHPVHLRLPLHDGPAMTHDATVVIVPAEDIHAAAQRSITVDGELDDLAGVPGFDLLADGEVKMSGHQGADDLSGQLWFTWDADNLYLSARIVDDTHHQPNTGADIWAGDSIQFSAAAGMPGETSRFYEYGLALTSSGPQVYRWLAAEGETGPVTDADVQITRDEAAKETVYELALPWSRLAPFDPDNRLLSLSLLVNDNDGVGRKGWIEWGGGIGSGKNPALFKPVRLDPAS
jgi:hypothetical protein